MTNREIRIEAFKAMRLEPGRIIGASLNIFSLFAVILLIESLIVVCTRLTGRVYDPLNVEYYTESYMRIILLAARILFYFAAYSAVIFIIRRRFIDMNEGGRLTERFLSCHKRVVVMPGVKRAVQLAAFKLLVLSPITIGIYGISYFMSGERVDEISLFGLMCFMLSIGFTIVWAGVSAHYFMSLSLVPYISELNPRANFFDACDLSIKLMDGKHYRLISFYISMLPIMLTSVAIYPALAVLPYYIECRTILSRHLMGEHWQDKLAAMARRWEKRG